MAIYSTITTAGVTAAIAAGSGPKMQITTMKLGSGFNYAVTGAETALSGSVVYTSTTFSTLIIDANTIQYNLTLTTAVGGFSFGEIGLYLADGTLFAIKTLPTLQQKIASPSYGANVIVATISVNYSNLQALIDFTIFNLSIGQLYPVSSWAALPQANSTSKAANAYLVQTPTDDGYTENLVYTPDNGLWTFANYHAIMVCTATSAGSTSSTFTGTPTFALDGFVTNKYMLQWTTGTKAGTVVPLTGLTSTVASYSSSYPHGANGDQFVIYENLRDIPNSAISNAAGTATPLISGTAAVGTSSKFAREDHVHPSSAGSATPLMDGTAAVGTSTLFARQDHVHPHDTSLVNAAGMSWPTSGTRGIGIIFPDGTIMQRGLTGSISSGGTVVTYPTAFPTATDCVVGVSDTGFIAVSQSSYTRFGFTATHDSSGSGPFAYIAWGY